MVKDKRVLPNAFAMMKIFESVGSIIVTILAGSIREKTKGFQAVCALFFLMSLFATLISHYYIQKKLKE